MKNKMTKTQSIIQGAVAFLFILQANIFGADQVTRFFGKVNGYLVGSVGPLILTLGIVFVGFGALSGRPDGVQKGIWVTLGGLIISAAPFLAGLVVSYAK
jgi:hypothetical protein